MKKTVLNVGGNNKKIPIPSYYAGWQHVLLDIDPIGMPDVVADARNLFHLPRASYDAIYCSHNLEHYLHHHASRVLTGFWHLVKDNGFVEIRVPDLIEVMERVVRGGLDLDGTLYRLADGQRVLVHDVLYGFGVQMEASGEEFYAHRCGFSESSLCRFMFEHGFPWVLSCRANLEVRVVAFKTRPTEKVLTSLGFELDRLSGGKKMLNMSNLSARSALAWEAGEYDCAAAMGEIVLSCDTKNTEVALMLGEYALQKEDVARALESFNLVLSRDPDSLQAHSGLIRALKMSGNAILVSEYLEKLAEIDPDLVDLIQSLN